MTNAVSDKVIDSAVMDKLEDIRRKGAIIDKKLEELKRLENMCLLSGISFEGERVQSSLNPKRRSEIMDCYIQMKDDIETEIAIWLKDKQEIMRALDDVEDVNVIKVVYSRFLENKRIIEVAEEMKISCQRVYQLIDKACDLIKL